VCWMLMAWVRPRFAFFGGLLASLHPMVLLWGQCYHGGAPAMLGGSLLLGGMRRAVDLPGSRSALAMGLGMAILAITRPYEGVALSLLSLATLAIWNYYRAGVGGVVRLASLLPPMIVPVAITLAGLAFYNAEVTGSPTRLPYMVYESRYSTAPIFLFQSRSGQTLEFNNPEFARFNADITRDYDKQRSMAIPQMIVSSYLLAAKAFFPLFAAFLKDQSEGLWESARSLPLVVLQLPLFVWPCIAFSRTARIPSLLLGAFTGALALATWKNNQYAAPAFGLMLVLTIQSIRLWRRWKWRGWPIGRFGERITMAGYVLWPVLLFVVWPALKSRPHMGHERAALVSRLQEGGGRHLVIVRYGPRHVAQEEWVDRAMARFGRFRAKVVHEEWVYNEADIDRAAVVWARDLGAERNRQLLDYFKDRQVWLFEPDDSPIRLLPYPGTQEENVPTKAIARERADSIGPRSVPSLVMASHAR